MKVQHYILRRILTGIIAFILTITIIATIYEINYEINMKHPILAAYRGIVNNMRFNGEFEGKTAEEIKEIKAEVLLACKAKYGLHRPRTVRIFERTYKAITCDWGEAWLPAKIGHRKENVKDLILDALPNTLILFVSTTIISILISIYLGIKKAQHANSFFDRITSILTMFFMGIPSWVTGSFLILFFVYFLKILPFGALYSTNPPPVGIINIILDRLKHMAIPIMAVVLVRIWGSSYQIKNILLSHLQEDYITSARGRGLPERKVLFGHALRSAFPAIITIGLFTIVESISGDIVLEKVLAWPGLGLLLWEATMGNEMELIMGLTTVLTLIFVFAMVILDISYVFLDPRIKYS